MTATSYQVTIGARVVQVRIRRAGDHILAQVADGDEVPVRLTSLHGPLRSVMVGSRHAEVLLARAGNAVSVAIDGLDFEAEVLDEAHARLASVAGSRGPSHARRELKAPMPGLLVSVLCAVGDEVAPGQPLAVLRAMKMENELSLPHGGKVTAIVAEAGQTVDQGQPLLAIE